MRLLCFLNVLKSLNNAKNSTITQITSNGTLCKNAEIHEECKISMCACMCVLFIRKSISKTSNIFIISIIFLNIFTSWDGI